MTGLIIAIVVIAIIALVLFAFVMPRARAKARERQIVRQRDEVATAHRERADDRAARAEYAEQQARRERAEAELHESRARLHERGLADDELDTERERLGTADGDGYADGRGERLGSERDATVPPEERR
jgi:uncharacterized protein HemX